MTNQEALDRIEELLRERADPKAKVAWQAVRMADLERSVHVLVEALQQILDWTRLDGPTYCERWGNTPRGDFRPGELAYAVLSDVGVLPEGVEK